MNIALGSTQGGGWRAEYLAYYNSLTVKPPPSVAHYQSVLFASLIDLGLFTNVLDWMYMLAQYSNDNGEALKNIVSPGTFDGSLEGAVGFTSLEGTTGNGITTYGKTGWNPSTDAVNFAVDSAFMFCYVRSAGHDNKWDMGCKDGSNTIALSANYLGELFGRLNAATNMEVFNDEEIVPGFYYIVLSGTTLKIGRNNYVLEIDAGYTPVALPDAEVYFNGFNNNGSPGFLSTRQQSFVGAGAAPTDAQIEGLRVAIENYMDGVSKGVTDILFGQEVDNYVEVSGLSLSDSIVIEPGVHFLAQNGRFRIPSCEITNNNVLIVGTDVRHGSSGDYTITDVGIRRSTDFGASWLSEQLVLENQGVTTLPRVNNHSILINRNTGRIFIFATRIDDDTYFTYYGADLPWDVDFVYKYSDDDGATWSSEVSLSALFDSETNLIQTGSSTVGITMMDGTLIMPVYNVRHSGNITESGSDFAYRAALVYSTDNGATWSMSPMIEALTLECSVVEYEAGKLMLSTRRWSGNNNKRVFTTDDLGTTWVEHSSDRLPYGFICNHETHIMQYNFERYGILTMPLSMTDRSEVEMLVSKDFGTWKKFRQLNSGIAYGYTCICSNSTGRLFIVLEKSDGIHVFDMANHLSYL